jgi:ATP-binding protein involved in chromosome partitioning
MQTPTETEIRNALRAVPFPGLEKDIVSAGAVRSVSVRNGRAHVALLLPTRDPQVREGLRDEVARRLAAAGTLQAEVVVLPPGGRPGTRDPWAGRGRLPGVKRIVAVGAGKGGVGKSTVAANLALALRDLGLRCGVMDADIYGPSIPMILGLEDGAERVELTPDRKILPLEAHGLAVVSFGFFLGPGSPAVWRGPMVAKAVKQFSRGVVWPELDVLVVDLPPGTGDVPLSLAQGVVVDGGLVVTTPQRLAVQEAGKALEMFQKLDVPALGIVENMSVALCACGRRSHPFGRGGGKGLAGQTGVPLLAEIPFDAPVVEGEDRGAPPLIEDPRGTVAAAFAQLAVAVAERLGAVATVGADG